MEPTARANVKPTTDLAPASLRAHKHASSVAPVVITSSSSRIRKLSTRPPFLIAKAPHTASQGSSEQILLRTRPGTHQQNPATGPAKRRAKGRPKTSTWLKPRSLARRRCSRASSARRSANQVPRGSIPRRPKLRASWKAKRWPWQSGQNETAFGNSGSKVPGWPHKSQAPRGTT